MGTTHGEIPLTTSRFSQSWSIFFSTPQQSSEAFWHAHSWFPRCWRRFRSKGGFTWENNLKKKTHLETILFFLPAFWESHLRDPCHRINTAEWNFICSAYSAGYFWLFTDVNVFCGSPRIAWRLICYLALSWALQIIVHLHPLIFILVLAFFFLFWVLGELTL